MDAPSYYAPPVSAPAARDSGQVPPVVIDHLARTQPWVRLTAVVGLLMLILSIGSFIYNSVKLHTAYGSSFSLVDIVFAIGNTVLAIFAFVRLSMYASAIKRLTFSRSPMDLVSAILQQKVFWKLIAISILISLAKVGYDLATGGWGAVTARPGMSGPY